MLLALCAALAVAAASSQNTSHVLDYRELNHTRGDLERGVFHPLSDVDVKRMSGLEVDNVTEKNVSVDVSTSDAESPNKNLTQLFKYIEPLNESTLALNTLMVPKFGFIKINNNSGIVLDHQEFRQNLSEAISNLVPVLTNKTAVSGNLNTVLNMTKNVESEGSAEIAKLKAALGGVQSDIITNLSPSGLNKLLKSVSNSENVRNLTNKSLENALVNLEGSNVNTNDIKKEKQLTVDSMGYQYVESKEPRPDGMPPAVQVIEESPAYASSVVLASDILSLSSAVAGVRNKLCREQGHRFLEGLLTNKRWALKMFDASAKSPQGLLFGSSYHLGNFDECIAIEEDGLSTPNTQHPLVGKYCLANIDWPQSEAVRKQRSGRGGELRWAVCVPGGCDARDVRQFVLDVLARTVGNISVSVHEADCYTRAPPHVTTLDQAFICLIAFFVLIVVICTALDVWWARHTSKRHTILQDIAISFSANYNLHKLLSTKQPNGSGLDCIAGIKTLAMVFITAGHACLFIASGPVMDADAWDRLLRHPMNSFMLNNTLLVDTFLMLSAFLFCRLLLLELDKRRGKVNVLLIYIFRYIRVTPAYFVVILFYMTWLPKMDTGPLWKDKLELEQARCSANWWANILYINNYVNTDALCMFQSWYLSVDTQLFFLAPAFIYPLWCWRRAGPAILSVATVISAVIPAVVTYENNLDPTLMVYAKEFKDISQNQFFKEAYIKTHMKLTPYFMGLWFGYILHVVQANNYKFSGKFRAAAWSTSVVLGTSVVFSVSLFYQEWFHVSRLDAVSYAALHKLGWGLANGWLIIACATGNGGVLGSMLTWKFLVPISRLTFCAYLVNGIVELYYIGTVRHPLHISFFSVFATAVSHILLTFILALALCLVLESPLHGIEKVLLRTYARASDKTGSDLSTEEASRSTSTSHTRPEA